MSSELLVILIFLLTLICFLLIIHFIYRLVMLWLAALAAGVRVPLTEIIGMRLRNIPPKLVVQPLIKATKAGLDVNLNQLETHHLAGGNPMYVVDKMIAAKRDGIDLTFEEVAVKDLKKDDVAGQTGLFMLWISALASDVRVSPMRLIQMRLRRVRPDLVVNPLIQATKAGLDINIDQLEKHHLAGGNAKNVVEAMILSK